MNQCDQILEALQKGERLTGMEILTRFNCMNYKGRISDLRRMGHHIITDMIKTPTGKHVAQYRLPSGQLELSI